MMDYVEIMYLHHSGFAVKTDRNVLIFDYYKDPAHILSGLLQESSNAWVFASHAHSDHFNPVIFKWKENINGYFLSEDIRVAEDGSVLDKTVFMKPYDTVENRLLKVTTYGSTDEGVSFLVEVDGWRIFHAGDLNWWHWKGDTPENLRLAEAGFRKEIGLLAGQKLDVAFFPVDSRLEEYRAIGAEEFCRAVDVGRLVTMHSCGKIWTPPEDFPGKGKTVAVWCPRSDGETQRIEK
jgi:L-ascorbate metabolism protein UlaG (beta-lactamase superfamily)